MELAGFNIITEMEHGQDGCFSSLSCDLYYCCYKTIVPISLKQSVPLRTKLCKNCVVKNRVPCKTKKIKL